jgi:hypothetical protein
VAAGASADAGDADLVVLNANVYTMDTGLPRAEAFAVKNARFIAAGANAEVTGVAGKDTRTIDAKRMTVGPGFTDCNNHAGGEVLLYETLVGNPFEVEFAPSSTSWEPKRSRRRPAPGSRNSDSARFVFFRTAGRSPHLGRAVVSHSFSIKADALHGFDVRTKH